MLRASSLAGPPGDSDNEASQLLRFGDLVSFYDNEHKGYLFSRLSSTPFSSLAVRGADSMTSPSIGNFQTCVFEIQAHNKYKANRKLQSAIDRVKAKEPHLTEDQILLEGGQELHKLKALADAETADNELEQRRRRGDPVTYGQLLQLYHRHSDKYVRVSSTSTSRMEPSNMRVEMESLNSKNAWFRIMPRYKVRAEGDYVRTNDQVVIESVKTEGQYIHSSNERMNISRPDAGCHEVNLSVAQTSFLLRGHAAAVSEDSLLKAGSVIQLFHKEISAWLAAEGIYQEKGDGGIFQDVHMRIRDPDPKRPSRLYPPTSAVTYWQVEVQNQQTKGDVIKWEDQIKLRHVTTQKYLTASRSSDGTSVLRLQQDGDDERDSVFRMHAVIKEQDAIELGTYTRIERMSDGHWVHAHKATTIPRDNSSRANSSPIDNELSRKMDAIQWDGATLCAATVTRDQLFDDAFIITGVESDKVDEVSFVMGMIPICRLYIEQRASRELQPLEAQRLLVALAEFRDFMFVNGTPVKSRQKLLRNLGVVELIVQMLQAPFAPFNTSNSKIEYNNLSHSSSAITRRICGAAYKVLQAYLDGDSRKNELYIAKHIPFFETQVGKYLGVEKMYTELVRDNQKIVFSFGENEIRHFVDLLKRDKNSDYLDFLSVLCECEGAPIGANQTLVTKMLLEEGGKGNVYLTEVNNGRVEVNTSGHKDDWQPLQRFAASAMDEDDRTSSKEYLFLQYQLDLFGNLCLGRNDYAIDVITKKLKYLTWDECFMCAQDDHLPKSLRAKYVALMSNLFVDVGDNVDILENVELTYAWDKLTATPNRAAMQERTVALSGAKMDYFPELSKWLIGFLDKYPSMVASDRPTNMLLAEVLNLCTFLVKFGYFIAPDDIKNLMRPLGGLVNGLNDLPQDGKKVTFASSNQQKDFVREWRNSTRYARNANNEIVVDAKTRALEAIDALFNFCFTVRIQIFLYDFKQCAEWGGDRRSTRQKGQAVTGDDGAKLTFQQMRALQAMTKATDEESCLGHIDSVREYLQELFDRCNWIHPGWAPGQKWRGKNDNLVDVLLDLANYDYSGLLIQSLTLLNRFYSAQFDLFAQVKQAMVLTVPESLDLAERLRRKVPVLRRLGAGLVEDDEADEFIAILREFEQECYLGGDMQTPHRMNQDIIYNSSIVDEMLDIGDHEGQSAPVLSAVFRFLRAICLKHEQVQEDLFDRLDNLTTIETEHTGWENDLAFCLTEIFTNNQEMCIGVKVRQVEHFMRLLAEHSAGVPNLLLTLQAVAKVEELNVPLKRNQHLIMKYLMQYRSKVIDCAYIDDASDPVINQKRMQLLSRSSTDKKLKAYHLNLVSLLAACAEGENRFIESMCQTIFSVKEILEVLNDTTIETMDKGSYIRFFLWVYLNTAGSPIEIGTADLFKDPALWSALKLMATNEITGYALPNRPLTTEQSAFAFNSFVPALTKIVKTYYKPNTEDIDDPESIKAIQGSQEAVKMLGGIMSDFATRVVDSLFDRQQIKALSACMMAIAACEPSSVPKSVLANLGSKLTSGEAGILDSDALMRYKAKYKKQIELNQYLNAYTKNVRIAYGGHNTVHFQLPNSTTSQEVALRAYCEDEDDDETLPLGPEFQAHVGLFANYRTVGGSRTLSEINTRRVAALRRQLRASHTYGATLDAQEKGELDALDIKSLQIVRALVHNEIKLEQDSSTVQNQIAGTKALLPIADMLHSDEDDVVREALACLVALLQEGNDAAQATFEEHFLGTREETFFDDVQTRMRRSLDSLREMRVLQKQAEEERQRQNKLMGTLTLAGALGGQMKDAVNNANQRQAAIQLDLHNDSSNVDIEMQPIVKQQDEEDEALQIKDEGNIELVLRVLQLMCEGHNNTLQNYLRTQPDNIRSIDLVAETVTFLQVLVEDISSESMPLMIQTLETLVEFAQGCQENQATIFDSRAVDHVNQILRYPDFIGCSDEEVAHLKLMAGVLVLSMLEDSNVETELMAKELEEVLDMYAIFRTMDHYYKVADQELDADWETPEDDDDEPVEAMEVAFTYYNIIRRMQDFTKKDYSEEPEFCPFVKPKDDGWGEDKADEPTEGEGKDDQPAAIAKNYDNSSFEELSTKTLSIEILRFGRLQRIYFMDKWRQHLRNEVKEDVLWNVDRSSPSDKIRDFVERCRVIMADIDYLRWVQGLSPVTSFIIRFNSTWNQMLLLLTFALNIIILAGWEAPRDWAEPEPEVDSWYNPVLYILGGAHIFFSFLVSAAYFLVHPPSFQTALESMPFYSCVEHIFPASDSLRTKTSAFSIRSLYYLLVIVFSVLGLIFYGYFYAFHLLHIVVNNDILLRVIQSVTKNGKSLLWVAALMVIVIYIYSLIAFAAYRIGFDEQEGAYCQSSWQCFISSLRLGLMSGGGLGEAIPFPVGYSFAESGLKTLFDLSFFIIITTIGLNVVFGIIVDTFSELRDEKYQIQDAMESECFICSLKNYDFERFGNGFQHHVKKEHNMWNYLFYMMHLAEKDITDYTSHEQYVFESLADNKETAVFPINRALALQNSEESGVDERLNGMQETLNKIVERLDRQDARHFEEQRRLEAQKFRQRTESFEGLE